MLSLDLRLLDALATARRFTWLRNITDDLTFDTEMRRQEMQPRIDLSGCCWLRVALRALTGACLYWIGFGISHEVAQDSRTDGA